MNSKSYTLLKIQSYLNALIEYLFTCFDGINNPILIPHSEFSYLKWLAIFSKIIIVIIFFTWPLSGCHKSPSVQVYHVIRLNTRATLVILSPHFSITEIANTYNFRFSTSCYYGKLCLGLWKRFKTSQIRWGHKCQSGSRGRTWMLQ